VCANQFLERDGHVGRAKCRRNSGALKNRSVDFVRRALGEKFNKLSAERLCAHSCRDLRVWSVLRNARAHNNHARGRKHTFASCGKGGRVRFRKALNYVNKVIS